MEVCHVDTAFDVHHCKTKIEGSMRTQIYPYKYTCISIQTHLTTEMNYCQQMVEITYKQTEFSLGDQKVKRLQYF